MCTVKSTVNVNFVKQPSERWYILPQKATAIIQNEAAAG